MKTTKIYGTDAKNGLPHVKFNADDRGEVHAIVSVFGNTDLQGDRVIRGAFEESLRKWRASGDPIPVIFSHDWADPLKHIGRVTEAFETPRGLEVKYLLDIDTNPVAAQVFRLLKERRVREHSFAYDIKRERPGDDGANELVQLDIIEIGPTLRGANTETQVLSVKSESGAARAASPALAPESSAQFKQRLIARFGNDDHVREALGMDTRAIIAAKAAAERAAVARAEFDMRSLALMSEEPGRVLVDASMRPIFDEVADPREAERKRFEAEELKRRQREREAEDDAFKALAERIHGVDTHVYHPR